MAFKLVLTVLPSLGNNSAIMPAVFAIPIVPFWAIIFGSKSFRALKATCAISFVSPDFLPSFVWFSFDFGDVVPAVVIYKCFKILYFNSI